MENQEKRGIKSLPGSVQNPGLLWRQMGERSCLCETNIWWGLGVGGRGCFPDLRDGLRVLLLLQGMVQNGRSEALPRGLGRDAWLPSQTHPSSNPGCIT